MLLAPTTNSVAPRLNGRTAAFFDVDNTVLPGEASEVRFFRWLWQRGVVGWPEIRASLSWLARHLPAISLHPLRERKLYLAGKPSRLIRPLGEAFCREQLCSGVSEAALQAIEEHRKAGHAIILLSGSLDFLIHPLAVTLQAEQCFAGRLEQIDGIYTGRLVPPLPYGQGKRRLIEQLAKDFSLDLSRCYAYGDSPGDFELLQAVGYPTVINPIRGMARVARQNRWPVRQWR
ncbi:MAG: HAD-IB family hydrolase [Nitrospira sp.]|nr:HAD-IB family hydrolase [Nitrospira sp.]MCP9464949.1 HAD-IB family hydrolase [Nitrospira sp.]